MTTEQNDQYLESGMGFESSLACCEPQAVMPGISQDDDALISTDEDLQASRVPISNREAFVTVTAGFLGWTLDAFDFFLVVISLPRIAADFQVKTSVIAFSLTLTLMFRPVGAFIFGLLADRYGRRMPMMIDLIFYSMVEVLPGSPRISPCSWSCGRCSVSEWAANGASEHRS